MALGLGALIGAERERMKWKGTYVKFGGLRTFMFITLLGAVAQYVSSLFLDWFLVVVFLGLVFLMMVAYIASAKASNWRDLGLTGEVTALLSFLIGVLCFAVNPFFAVALSIITTTFLYLKERLHSFVRNVKKEEIYSTLIFAIVAFVILPFLPNVDVGPFGFFNPFKVWLMVVFVSGLSYVGYILIRFLGERRGLGFTGFLGGMVSSTAVTISMAQKSRHDKSPLLVFAAVVANGVMILRVFLAVYVINKSLLLPLIPPLGVMAIVAFVSSWVLWRFYRHKKGSAEPSVEHSSPFTIGPALKFAFIFSLTMLVVRLAESFFGSAGVYVASFLSGFVDVDAIVLAMANLVSSNVSPSVAVNAITIAVMSNTMIKFFYASLFGSKEFRKKMGLMFSLIILAGLLVVLLI